MRRKLIKESGLLTLEASIAVTIFIFLMLFMYSIFVIFEVRNEIGHTVLSTANSMSIDAFENSKLGDSDTLGQIFYNIYGSATNSDTDFTDYKCWYDSTTEKDANGNEKISSDFESVIRARFIAYLTGGGSADDAETVLKRYHVVGGVEGLDFSGSSVSDGKLYLSVKYEIEYEFNVFNLGKVKFEQSACSKLWK